MRYRGRSRHQPEAEQSLRIESRNDIEIVCLSGLLRVTQPAMRATFVAPDEPLRLVPSGLTLVTAMVPSALRARGSAVAGGRAALALALGPPATAHAGPCLPRDRSAGL